MPRLVINTSALRHNLAVVEEKCRKAGAECMFVFKEAPLHLPLVAAIMAGGPVRKLGLVAWPGRPIPELHGIEIHHIYAPSSLMLPPKGSCRCIYVNSQLTLRFLSSLKPSFPEIRLVLEAGDGRDGILSDEIPSLCQEAQKRGFSLRGLAVNFACMTANPPTRNALCCAAQALEKNREFFLSSAGISAGGTDILELAEKEPLPSEVEEIRCGTGITLGCYPLSGTPIPEARQDAFRLEAQVLECRIKQGKRLALFDTGTFHTAPQFLKPPFPGMVFRAASSAYASFEITGEASHLREGSVVSFPLDYHSLSSALISQALPLCMEER